MHRNCSNYQANYLNYCRTDRLNESLERTNYSNWKRATADKQQQTANELFADEPLKLQHFVKNWLRPATVTKQAITTAILTNEPNEQTNDFLKSWTNYFVPIPTQTDLKIYQGRHLYVRELIWRKMVGMGYWKQTAATHRTPTQFLSRHYLLFSLYI